MFCRDDRTLLNPGSPTYQVMDSLVKNATGSYIPQIIPNKTRCGNLDPKEMNITEKCYCLAKDKKGAGRFTSNEIGIMDIYKYYKNMSYIDNVAYSHFKIISFLKMVDSG